jgi:hypothetical protein
MGAESKVHSVIEQQKRLLKRLDDVSHYLGGVGAGLYLPGINCTFDNPFRRVDGRRPPIVTLEVCDDGSLKFTGAISRPRNGKLTYSPIFSYDVSRPYTPRGDGQSLPANNIVLARRANELLAALSGYGRRVSFGMHEALPALAFPEVIREHGRIVAENYTCVLGFEVDNPAVQLDTVLVRRRNPAEKILARHGIEYPMSVGPVELENLVTELRAEFPTDDIDWVAGVEALLFKQPHFSFSVSRAQALVTDPDAVVSAMRALLPKRYQFEAAYSDLLIAARNPEQPLKISRLSAIQLFPIETAYDLPDGYGGSVLTRINMVAPSSTRQDVVQVTA